MNNHPAANNLAALLDLLQEAGAGQDRISIGAMLEAVGRRSFGALLLVPGLIAFSPLSGIPGIPTSVGIMVLLIAGQMLLGRKHFWVPEWLLRRSVPRDRFERSLRFLRPVARFIDKLIRPRLAVLTHHIAVKVVSALAVFIGIFMPPMELLPFAATIAGAALTAFGLALIANDGLLLIMAILFYATTLGFIAAKLL